MSNIGGKKKEQVQQTEYAKKVGLFEANVVAVNPNAEEYNDILGIELKEDSKAIEYLGKSQDGNITLRVDFWLEEIKNKDKFKVTFFLENKEKENKDATKKQYINEVGVCSWAADANDLPELYNFMRTWLGSLDYRDASTTLQLDWKSLMKGNAKDIKGQVGGEYSTSVLALATIKTVVKNDETKEYQGVYNKAFLPAYNIRQFRLIDYNRPDVLSAIRQKKSKDLRPHERFVLNITGEYGCKDFYVLKDMKDYNANDNLVASDSVLSEDGADY